MNAGLDGRPDIAYDWGSVESYLDRLDALRPSVNLAFLVGNSALRMAAIGWDEVEASEADVANMRSMLREAMEEGAIGLSSGLDYPPGAYASTDELAELTREAARHGGFYHTHVRYALGDRYLDPFREAIEIGRRGEGPAHITHFYHRQTFPGGPEPMLALVDDARAEGLDVTFDTYPYEWASTRLLIMIPPWVQAGGPMADQGAPRRSGRSRPHSARARGARRPLRGPQRLGRRPARRVRAPGAAALGGPHARRAGARPRRRFGRRAVRPAARGGPARRTRSRPGPWTETLPRLHPPPGRDDRHRLDLRRREAVAADVRLVPARPRPIRPRGGTLEPGRGRPLDDVGRRRRGSGFAIAGCSETDSWPTSSSSIPERVRSNATYDEPRQFPDGIEWVVVGRRRGRCERRPAHRRAVWTRPATALIIAPRAAPNRAHAQHDARRGVGHAHRPEPRDARVERTHR